MAKTKKSVKKKVAKKSATKKKTNGKSGEETMLDNLLFEKGDNPDYIGYPYYDVFDIDNPLVVDELVIKDSTPKSVLFKDMSSKTHWELSLSKKSVNEIKAIVRDLRCILQ